MFTKCVILVLILSMTTLVQGMDLFNDLASFNIHPESALVGHVIKTLPLFKADCMTTCKETLSCFSINVYKNQQGGDMCDLNRSNKKQSPTSLVRMAGYQYAEPYDRDKQFCIKDKCLQKDALPDKFFRFNSSSYKLFTDKKTWTEAREVCQEQGGNLASFDNQLENDFVLQTLFGDLNGLINISKQFTEEVKSITLMRLKMDGSDENLSLQNGAELQTKDGRFVLYFDGTNHAQIPRFDLHDKSFTYALWLKPMGGPGQHKLFVGYDSSGSARFEFEFDLRKINTELETSTMAEVKLVADFVPSLTKNIWVHLALAWDKDSRTISCYANGLPTIVDPNTISSPDPELFLATEPMYDIGLGYRGWIADMVVISRILTVTEINDLMKSGESQGVWIGMNDRTAEGTIGWSDGSPLTYKPNEDMANSDNRDCGILFKMNEEQSMWVLEDCMKKAPFICEIN